MAGRAFHFGRQSFLKVKSFVTVEKHPGTCFHRVRIVDGAAGEARRPYREAWRRRCRGDASGSETQRRMRAGGGGFDGAGPAYRQDRRTGQRRATAKKTAPGGETTWSHSAHVSSGF
jgi:hypothetical protein